MRAARVYSVMRAETLFVLALPVFAQDAAQIVLRSVQRDARNFELLKDYTYTERTELRRFGPGGKIQSTESNTFSIEMLDGRSYRRKIAHNDQPLSDSEARKVQENLDRRRARWKNESAADKAKREKRRLEDRAFLRKIPDAFTLKLLPVEQVSGKPAWVIEAEPKPGFKPHNLQEKVLSKVRGKLWIDQAEYQWVKGDLEVLDTLSIGLSLLRIAPGTVVHFEQARVNEEVWLPALQSLKADARVGYIKRLRAEQDTVYRDYKKFQTDSRIVGIEEPQH